MDDLSTVTLNLASSHGLAIIRVSLSVFLSLAPSVYLSFVSVLLCFTTRTTDSCTSVFFPIVTEIEGEINLSLISSMTPQPYGPQLTSKHPEEERNRREREGEWVDVCSKVNIFICHDPGLAFDRCCKSA